MSANVSSRGEVKVVKKCGSGREIRLKGWVVALLERTRGLGTYEPGVIRNTRSSSL